MSDWPLLSLSSLYVVQFCPIVKPVSINWTLIRLEDIYCTSWGWHAILPGLIIGQHGAHLEPNCGASPWLTHVGSTCWLGQQLTALDTCCTIIRHVLFPAHIYFYFDYIYFTLITLILLKLYSCFAERCRGRQMSSYISLTDSGGFSCRVNRESSWIKSV